MSGALTIYGGGVRGVSYNWRRPSLGNNMKYSKILYFSTKRAPFVLNRKWAILAK